MRVPDDHPLSVTLALRTADTVVAALQELEGRTDPVTTAGLLELVSSDRWGKPTLTAVDRLTAADTPLSVEVLRVAFVSRFAPVRLLARSYTIATCAISIFRDTAVGGGMTLTRDSAWSRGLRRSRVPTHGVSRIRRFFRRCRSSRASRSLIARASHSCE